jgi:hypothetical protein
MESGPFESGRHSQLASKAKRRNLKMSSHQSEPWIDTWWPVLVITFGIIFVTFLVSFKPTI